MSANEPFDLDKILSEDEDRKRRIEALGKAKAITPGADVVAHCESVQAQEQYFAAQQLSPIDAQCIQRVYNALETAVIGPKAGKPACTMANFCAILMMDTAFTAQNGAKFSSLRWNELTETPEVCVNDKYTRRSKFVPVDNAFIVQAMEHIEKYYQLCNKQRFEDSLIATAVKKPFHPLRSVLDALEWDGIPRVSEFLTKWACAGDSAYVREVSRLLFATGIHRALNPGCDIDGMPVFISPVQGCGKSTLCKWLSLGLYSSLAGIEGKEAAENLCGKWLIEIEELKALQGRFTNNDSIKQFITATSDYFRVPYEKVATDHPRSCFFIGTTNSQTFLTDPTGNRRFFPINFGQSIDFLQAHADECKHEIEQAWAEAYTKFRTDEMRNFFDRSLLSEAEAAQKAATIEDEWEGYILSYLEQILSNDPNLTHVLTPDRKQAVCAPLIYNWLDAKFGAGNGKSYSRQQHGQRIGQIMAKRAGWKRGERPEVLRFKINGMPMRQRYWFYDG